MRVLIVHATYRERGGEDAVAEMEARQLRARGHDVVLWAAPRVEGGLPAELTSALRAVWSPWAHAEVRRRCREHRAGVVHIHNFFPALSPSAHYAAAASGAAVVQTLHNFRLLCIRDCFVRDRRHCTDCLGKIVPWPGLRHACYRGRYGASAVLLGMIVAHRMARTWRRAVDGYIAPTEGVRRRFVEAGFDGARIDVKPHAVEPPEPDEAAPRDGALFVGRLTSEKGVHLLIEAWEAVRPPGRLTIVGDGPERRYLEGRAAGVPGIEFAGALDHPEVLRRMQRARALVFPSVGEESFGLTIAEAFACGTPVIAFRHGSAADLVTDRRTGWLVPPGDARGLGAALGRALGREEECAARGALARRTYEERFTPARTAAALEEIYGRCIDRARARNRGKSS